MSKAFTKESDSLDNDNDETEEQDVLPTHIKNYMTPSGCAALQQELKQLTREERPKIVETVTWAASNGDRSENGDYIYGKKRLREIDRRIRYISKRLQTAEIVSPAEQHGLTQVFFGATVTYIRHDESEHTVTLVGIDEANLSQGKISWISPVAKALLKAKVGDEIELRTPSGTEIIEVISIIYR